MSAPQISSPACTSPQQPSLPRQHTIPSVKTGSRPCCAITDHFHENKPLPTTVPASKSLHDDCAGKPGQSSQLNITPNAQAANATHLAPPKHLAPRSTGSVLFPLSLNRFGSVSTLLFARPHETKTPFPCCTITTFISRIREARSAKLPLSRYALV